MSMRRLTTLGLGLAVYSGLHADSVTVAEPPPIEFPQPIPVGEHLNATTSIVLRPLTGVYAPPLPPSAITVLPGTKIIISPPLSDASIASIAWYRDGRPLTATGSTLTIPDASRGDEGFYSVTITRVEEPPIRVNFDGSYETIRLRVGTEQDHKFLNLSSRTTISPANPTLICGFVIAPKPHDPEASKQVLFRAIGPSLALLGVKSPLAHPKFRIFNQDGSEYGGAYAFTGGYVDLVAGATARTGAFPLINGASDATDVRPMPPGIYTVHVSSEDSGTGDVLFEIYEVPESPWPPAPYSEVTPAGSS